MATHRGGPQLSGTTLILVPLVLAVLAAFGLPGHASAHPLGNFTVNRYARIETYRDLIRVTFILDLAEIPTFQEMGAIDPNNDGASPEELQGWATRVSGDLLPSLLLTIDGRPLALAVATAEATSAPGQSNLPILRLTSTYEAALPADSPTDAPATVAFRDTNYAGRLGWREIVVQTSEGARVTVPPGYLDRSQMLRAYPSSSLSEAPDERDVAFTWVVGTGGAARPVPLVSELARRVEASGFERLIAHNPSMETVLLSMIAAAGFGMLHAFGPGHGKTLVAAYLIGSRGTPRHAVALGLTVTATHTAAVYALGGAALVASAFLLPDRLYLGLSVLSGALVTAFGVGLFAQRLRVGRAAVASREDIGLVLWAHRHGPGGRAHTHGPAEHLQGHQQDRTHEDEGHGPVSWRSVLTLGVLGGLLPCPSAIVVMLAAVALGQALYGLLLIVAFSVGLAAVLTSLGLAVVLGRNLTARLQARHAEAFRVAARVQRFALLASPLAIAVIGIVLTVQALGQLPRGAL